MGLEAILLNQIRVDLAVITMMGYHRCNLVIPRPLPFVGEKYTSVKNTFNVF